MEEPLLLELTAGIADFRNSIDAFNDDFDKRGPQVDGISAKEASERSFMYKHRFEDLWRRFEMYQTGEKLFGLPTTEYPILHQRKKELNLLNKLYSLYLMVLKTIDGYAEIPWNEVDMEQIFAQVLEFQNTCRKLPKGMQTWKAYIEMKKKIDDFNETCPLLELMTSKAMQARHWLRLDELMSYSFEPEEPATSLGTIVAAPLLQFKEDVYDICTGADKESDIEAKLNQVIQDWSVVNLQFAPFKTRGDLLLKGTADVIAALEDSLMVMNSLATSRYNKPFKKKVMDWLTKLTNTAEILEKWMVVQTLWVYLEAVFVGGDISRQLPAEKKRFANIDKMYFKMLLRAREIVNVVETCTGDETMITLLPHLIEQLEACQKSLTGYLELKRSIFPRFFFVSDPVLLEILGQASDPTTIQPHLLSIFDAVATVEFQQYSNDKIIAMMSANDEHVSVPQRFFNIQILIHKINRFHWIRWSIASEVWNCGLENS